jgi:SAM-dependent methyltransferase
MKAESDTVNRDSAFDHQRSGPVPSDLSPVTELYDWLSRYVQITNWLAYKDPYAGFTMHKSLSVPPETKRVYGQTAGANYINDRLLEAANLPLAPRVLDAGCGFGGTIFHCHQRIGGFYDGFTVSRVQLRIAQREARRRGIETACRFYLQSYDAPLAGLYDAVIAIESLIYAADLNRTISHLAAALRPGGLMLIVEDMVKSNLSAAACREAAALCAYWSCRLRTRDDFMQALDRARLTVTCEEDLTSQVTSRNLEILNKLEARYTRLYRAIRFTGVRAIVSAYLGGVILERLYQTGEVCYRLIVARNDRT